MAMPPYRIICFAISFWQAELGMKRYHATLFYLYDVVCDEAVRAGLRLSCFACGNMRERLCFSVSMLAEAACKKITR